MRTQRAGQSALLLLDAVEVLTREQVGCIEDFIAMKVFAGGPQDIADARHALLAAKASINTNLLLRLAARYGCSASSELKKLLDN